MVGIGKACVDDGSGADGHVIRHQEAVHSDHILPTVVGGVGVAAAAYSAGGNGAGCGIDAFGLP